MASWDDVRRIALALPQTSERLSHGNASWRVRDKSFVWERPLRASDYRALGDGAPAGPILGVRTEHLVAKEALLADEGLLHDPPFRRLSGHSRPPGEDLARGARGADRRGVAGPRAQALGRRVREDALAVLVG